MVLLRQIEVLMSQGAIGAVFEPVATRTRVLTNFVTAADL